MERRECPLCVSRYCTNCFFKDVGVNRRWLALRLPDGECRRCGAHRNAVREKPVRHTSATVRQDHLDDYAQILLTKAPKLVPQDPQRMHAIDVLLATVDRDFFSAYSAHSRLQSGVYGWDAINVQNDLNAAKLRIEEAVRQWVADHPDPPIVPPTKHTHDFVGDGDECTWPGCRLTYGEYRASVQKERDRG